MMESRCFALFCACSMPTIQAFAATAAKGRSFGFSSALKNTQIQLTGDGGVQKEILFEGNGEPFLLPGAAGTRLTISYAGSLGVPNWSSEEVVSCWLKEQQGLDHLQDLFLDIGIDEAKLTNPEFFTEDFVTKELGVTAKIQCKKLVLAAKRLASTRQELPKGHVFDSNPEYSYELGSNKLIKGMEIGLSSMTPGEWALITVRSDYGYGSEGYRKANGDVIVPPFATLVFEIQLLPTEISEIEGEDDYVGLPENS
eukprot:scaffold2322_cov135-Cylindrotheca_fusiformis.AAC.26